MWAECNFPYQRHKLHTVVMFHFEHLDVVSVNVCLFHISFIAHFIQFPSCITILSSEISCIDFICDHIKKKQTKKIFYFYTAHGCILPTAPNNGQLISKTDDTVKFLCDPSYIFPDTFQSSRTLYCTDRNTWHDSLPNCVGMFQWLYLSLIEWC